MDSEKRVFVFVKQKHKKTLNDISMRFKVFCVLRFVKLFISFIFVDNTKPFIIKQQILNLDAFERNIDTFESIID